MTKPIKKENVVQDAIAAVEAGAFIPSNHALERMKERDIDFSDIEEAVYNARREPDKDSLSDNGQDWKYAIRGLNSNGDKDIRLIVAYLKKPKMLVITAIDKNL